MIIYVLQRLLGLVPVLFGISVVIFLTMKLIPGDVARALLGPMATDQSLAQLRHALGLDRPSRAVRQVALARAAGDWGSRRSCKPVVELLLPRFGIRCAGRRELRLAAGRRGIVAASRRRRLDRAAMGASWSSATYRPSGWAWCSSYLCHQPALARASACTPRAGPADSRTCSRT
jgi:hypothetical protein